MKVQNPRPAVLDKGRKLSQRKAFTSDLSANRTPTGLKSLCLICVPTVLCRAATTRDTRWWWTRWSTTSTSFPAASSTPRSPPSSVGSERSLKLLHKGHISSLCSRWASVRSTSPSARLLHVHPGGTILLCSGFERHAVVLFLVSCWRTVLSCTQRFHVIAATQLIPVDL